MQWISISDSSIYYGICEQKNDSEAVNRIYKRPLVDSVDSFSFQKEIKKKLIDILSNINKDIIVNKKIAMSLDINKCAIAKNFVDVGLAIDDQEKVLNWKMEKYFSDLEKFFIHHYPVSMPESENYNYFYSIAISNSFRIILVNTIVEYGFEPIMLDVGLFSVHKLLQKSFPVQSYEKWGLLEISPQNCSQKLLVCSDDNIAYVNYKLIDSDSIIILQNTEPKIINEEYIIKFVNFQYNDLNIDKVFGYSHYPADKSIRDVLENTNITVVNPLPILSRQKVQIDKEYLRDKYLLSQFSEIAGLISQFHS